MLFAAFKENAHHEKRVSLTPDVAKKLIELGHKVSIESDAGKEAGYPDDLYEKSGCEIDKNRENLLKKANVVFTVSSFPEEEVTKLTKQSLLIGTLKPYQNANLLRKLSSHKITSFSLELTPRITRAQSMDILSSQSNLAGYKAVIDAASEFGRALPLMMTAAGTIPAARVLILGAGVAGLQAIATARRLGAIVSAYDVRAASKEQVESLGATFVSVETAETGEGSGGYAKEMSDTYKKAQEEKLKEVLKNQDIIITTAQIPGKKAPVLVTEDMIKTMKPGSVIIDLAAESGGNCELSELGKTVIKHDVKIIGSANMPSRIATDASQLYARNVLNFLKNLMNKEGNSLEINWQDEIVVATALTHDGAIIHPNFKKD
jgi:NAD(P) transhydrogenase subunit alpha